MTHTVGGDRRGLLSVDEAAQYLGVAAGTLRNWVSMRRIEYVEGRAVGRLTRCSVAALDRHIAANTVLTLESLFRLSEAGGSRFRRVRTAGAGARATKAPTAAKTATKRGSGK